MLAQALAALSVALGTTNAHFTTGHLLVNGTDTGLWKHVLKVSTPEANWGYEPSGLVVPLYANPYLDTPNITCGRAAFDSLPTTSVASVTAGDELGFRTMRGEDIGDLGFFTDYFYHPGVAQVWLSRAPGDDLSTYRGEGDWFKIAYAGPRDDVSWELYDYWDANWAKKTDFNFTLPRTTPPGSYLLRFEYIAPTASQAYSQFFVNCALIDVRAPTPSVEPGKPTGFARFPGAYAIDDIGLWIPMNQDMVSGIPKEQLRIKEYKAPGPAVWKG